MIIELKTPTLGESITQATLSTWHVKDGDSVQTGQLLYDLETDKISTEGVAEAAGIIWIKAKAGTTVKVGEVVGQIETKSKNGSKVPLEKKIDEEKKQVEHALGERSNKVPLSPLRKTIGQRLLMAKNQTAMLTTFNEADMGRVMDIKKRQREIFLEKYGVKLGLMPFFIKAVVRALQEVRAMNCFLEEDYLVQNDYYDIGVAVGGPKGLIVPVVRDCERASYGKLEKDIEGYVEKIKTNKITLSDLEGGVFTISNGGVYGSLLSTPILNPPQSGILGMHTIKDRPVAINGQVVIRPMMNLALSYDHRVVDGKEAVGFLNKIKEYIENPPEEDLVA